MTYWYEFNVGRKPAPPWYGSDDRYDDAENSIASHTGTDQYRPSRPSYWPSQPRYCRTNWGKSATSSDVSPVTCARP